MYNDGFLDCMVTSLEVCPGQVLRLYGYKSG